MCAGAVGPPGSDGELEASGAANAESVTKRLLSMTKSNHCHHHRRHHHTCHPHTFIGNLASMVASLLFGDDAGGGREEQELKDMEGGFAVVLMIT